jgi:antibiotic biosynthesis monooxygenase (ABM) superfamily enzyme
MAGTGTTIVTQTRPAAGGMAAFAAWQQETSAVIAGFQGFIRQTVIPPNPPVQADWVILQHFADRQSAIAWLRSDTRRERVAAIQALIEGHDDVHLVSGDGGGGTGTPVSAVIATRVKPGREPDYRRWEQRIAAAQTRAAGFQGYRLEPPIPGIQDDWLAIVTFDTDAHLQAWLASTERTALVADSDAFTEAFHVRIAQTAFTQWFDVTAAAAAPVPGWKQNMVVLLLLYPVVFLFGAFVQTPWLMARAHVPFAAALFIGNIVSIVLLNYLVPWARRRLTCWLQPSGPVPDRTGTALVVILYGAMVAAFTLLF